MSRRRGNTYENEMMAQAEELGYATFAARGSRGVIDVLCFESALPGVFYADSWRAVATLCVQVGTTAKPIAATLAELDAAPRPIGSLCLVARRHRAKNRRISWTFHVAAGRFDTLAEAVAGEPSSDRQQQAPNTRPVGKARKQVRSL